MLFVCVHNAGRSQMAAALLERAARGRVEVLSAGSEPADAVHPTVVEAMRELGIDVSQKRPRRFASEDVQRADAVVTMGCGDACPVFPGTRYLDWDVEDPGGQPLERVREIRDDIDARVRRLARELL